MAPIIERKKVQDKMKEYLKAVQEQLEEKLQFEQQDIKEMTENIPEIDKKFQTMGEN